MRNEVRPPVEVKPSALGGALRAPASKSSMQRAIACALLAEGRSVLRNPSLSEDCLAALALAQGLGARVERYPGRVEIQGIGGYLRESAGGRPREPSALSPAAATARRVSCGESGLCIRMFSPVAALFPGLTVLEAEGSLARRPVGALEAPLAALGAGCETRAGLPPVRVVGPLRGGEAFVEGGTSSQFLTGLLVALPLAASASTIHTRGLVSRGYVDLTLATMAAFGLEASRDPDYGKFSIEGGQRARAADFEVEGDWSGAAFLLAAAALASSGGLRVEGLQTASMQPDRAVLEALELAGAALELGPGWVSARREELRAFEFDATDCPDLFPPLAALAAHCSGESRILGARRLASKESDRAEALVEGLGALGVSVSVEGDVMRIRGSRVRGGRVDSRGDHRIAMAAAVAALAAEGPVRIEGAACVAKSWPSFFEDLEGLRRP